jgi:tape measure domain-containing protein
MAEGQITRKDIITDEALNWGPDYAKAMEAAITANKKFADSILAGNEANNLLRSSSNQKEFIENQKKANAQADITIGKWKEQNQAELALISTKKKNELATESTNRKLTEERILLAQTNAQIKQETLERLGLVSAYTKLNNSRTEAKKRLQELIASEKASTIEIDKAQKTFDILDGKVKKADRAVGDFSKNVGNYKSAFKGLGDIFSAFGLVGGITGAVALGKEIFNTTKEIQSLDLALKSVTGSQENFKEQQSFLSTIANKYGLEIKDLTKQYTSFYVAAKNKLAATEIQNLFENISKSGSALGLSNETLGRSFTALNQMLSKGTVASEELRGQLAEALPGSVQAMVKAVQILHPEIKNLTEKGLFEMIKAGNILASEVLPETARQLVILTGADKAEGIETITKTVNRLSNSWTKMIISINESDTSGFSKFVKTIIDGLTNIIDFTGLLFKDENQLQNYFKDIGKAQGLEEFKAVMNNISTVSKEQQEATKKALLERERENIRVNQAIIKSEKEKRESIMGGDRALFHLQTKQEEDALVQIGKSAAIIKKLKEGSGTTAKSQSATTTASSVDVVQPRKVKLDDSAYQLEKQRLELAISINDRIAKDNEEEDAKRLYAIDERSKKEIALIDLNKDREFTKNKQIYDNAVSYAQAKMEADLSASKLTEEGKNKIKNQFKNDVLSAKDELLNTNEKTKINEKYAYDKLQIEKKASDEINKINEFDDAKYQKSLEDKMSKLNVSMNTELQAENERFKSLGDLEAMAQADKEKAIQDHEQKIYDIKKAFAIKTLKLQITTLEGELAASDLLPVNEQLSADKRQKIVETLSKAKTELSDVEVTNNKKNAETTVITEREKTEKILEMSSVLTSALTDLGDAVFERKIQNINDEITKNNEYYDRQIELAGNDERQKDLLTKEREKKNEELEKKKRKEQHKQAVFNKASAVAQAGISAALAVLAALSTQPFLPMGPAMAILAGVLGAIQIGAILATPIPKYKTGRKGGPAETAWVGDGFINEVITGADGSNPRLTPNKPTLANLNKGDIVHKSIEDYNRYMRASILNSFGNENQRIEKFQLAQFDNNNKELVNEMRLTRKAIEKNKTNITVNGPKIDIGHEIWKLKNTNWNQ